jgi:hypothetical protein
MSATLSNITLESLSIRFAPIISSSEIISDRMVLAKLSMAKMEIIPREPATKGIIATSSFVLILIQASAPNRSCHDGDKY